MAPSSDFPVTPLLIGETLTATFPRNRGEGAAAEARLYQSGVSPAPAPSVFTLEAIGGKWKLNADTATLVAGTYTVEVWETDTDSTRRVLARLPLTLIASGAGDPRSPAAIAVANLETYLSGDMSVKKYSIAGASGGARALEHYTPAELLTLLNYWRNRLNDERGIPRGRDILYSI